MDTDRSAGRRIDRVEATVSTDRRKPATQRETTDALWYTVIGTNGEGLLGKTERIETSVEEIKGVVHELVHSVDAIKGCVDVEDAPPKKKPRRLEIITIVLSVAISLQALGLLDAIRGIVWQALTGRPIDPPPAIERVEDASK